MCMCMKRAYSPVSPKRNTMCNVKSKHEHPVLTCKALSIITVKANRMRKEYLDPILSDPSFKPSSSYPWFPRSLHHWLAAA